jgi:hypothetical protein
MELLILFLIGLSLDYYEFVQEEKEKKRKQQQEAERMKADKAAEKWAALQRLGLCDDLPCPLSDCPLRRGATVSQSE